jgi:ribosomal 50S subunit-recycling heat shock protein
VPGGTNLRLDLFLKLSRIVKRRSAANDMITRGAVRVGHAVAKPSRALKPGDIVEVAFPRKILTFKVLAVDESSLRRGAPSFEVIEEKAVSGEERPW